MIFAPNNIKDFLFTPGKYFLIPEFQRPYSWEVENIRSYLEDLESLFDTDKKHYFGTVVYINDPTDLNASVIIDGQQRVTTALLMLMSIYHITRDNPEKSNIQAGEIEEKYLFNSAKYINQKNRIKLKAVTVDDLIFQKIFEKMELDINEKQNRVYQAYRYFYDYFNSKNQLERYVNKLQSFEIVTIALDSKDDNPQRVFESINSTGRPLTDGDKIRNFALMLNSNDERTYIIHKYWKNIESSLTDANKDYITDFFRSYIISELQTVIPLGSVYPEFKKLFERAISRDQLREELDIFYGGIIKALEYYRFVKFGECRDNRFDELKGIIFKMHYIQIELYIPFALSVLKHFDGGHLTKDELIRVFRILEIYFARRIVCNIAVTSVDKILASLHEDILEYQASTPETKYSDIMAFILLTRTGITHFPPDSEIATAIQNNQTYNQRKAHVNFILSSIDDQSKEAALLKQIAYQEVLLSIEHIMPQTISPQWRQDLGPNAEKIHEKYLHTLANLTLTGYNSEYSNRNFQEKKTMKDGFNDSPLKINAEIRNVSIWNEEVLIKRQEWWIDNIKRIWPLPTTTFKPVKVDTSVSLLDDIDLIGTKVRVLNFLGDAVPVSTWAQVLDLIVERAFEQDEEIFNKLIQDEFLARYIRNDSSALINPMEIKDTGYFVESGSNTNSKRMLISKLAGIRKWTRSDLTVELMEPIINHI